MNERAPIEIGEIVHVITRRSFDNEPRRHFVGSIVAASGLDVRVQGYAFIFDAGHTAMYAKQPELRTRIFNLADSGLIVNILPAHVVVDEVRYEIDGDGRLLLTDGTKRLLAISEFGSSR